MLPKTLRNVGCVLGLAAAGASLQGCETQRDWAASHGTAVGAGTGALLGAGAGALIDHNHSGRGALIGAAVGGLAGAGIGHMVQKQKEAFDRIQYLESRPTQVIVQAPPAEAGQPAPAPVKRDALRLTIPADVLFAKDSSTLTGPGMAKVREVSQVLMDYPDSDIQVFGYTSIEGGESYNMDLSIKRANSVLSELVRDGVQPSRITARGMGAAGASQSARETDRQMDRRVELVVVPRDEPAR